MTDSISISRDTCMHVPRVVVCKKRLVLLPCLERYIKLCKPTWLKLAGVTNHLALTAAIASVVTPSSCFAAFTKPLVDLRGSDGPSTALARIRRVVRFEMLGPMRETGRIGSSVLRLSGVDTAIRGLVGPIWHLFSVCCIVILFVLLMAVDWRSASQC